MVLARCGAEVAGIKAFWKQSYVLPRLYKVYLLKTIRMIETNAFKKETNVAHFYIEFHKRRQMFALRCKFAHKKFGNFSIKSIFIFLYSF